MNDRNATSRTQTGPLWRFLLRYFIPVTPQGPLRLDPFTLIRGYKRYLMRCGAVVLALHGLAGFFQARGHEILYGLSLAAIFPFGTIAVTCAILWWEVRGREPDD